MWQSMAGKGTQKFGMAAGKPAGMAAAGLGKPAANAEPTKVTVSSKVAGDKQRLATILGDYVAQGTNMGKKTYKKLSAIPGRPGTFAFLYFWDETDGPENCGWWFSDRVGGEEVWAFNPQKSQAPPTTGWKIPWDGPVYASLVLVHGGGAAAGAPTAAAGATPQKPVLGGLGQKPGVTPGAAAQAAQAAISANEERDAAAFQESLPATQELITAAESAIEAVVEMSGGLSSKLDESDEAVEEAIKEVEAKGKEAQEEVGKARNQVSKLLVEARKYAPKARNTAIEEFKVMQKKLGDLQVKLNPLKTPGQEIRKVKTCKQLMGQVVEKLGEAEGEADKAESEAKDVAAGGDVSDEVLQKVEECVKPATTALFNAKKLMETGMLKQVPAMAQAEMNELKERAKKLQERINEIKASIKEPRDTMLAEKIVVTASEKMKELDEALEKMEEAEMPFLKGIEDLPVQELEDTVDACTKAATAAQKSVNEVKLMCKQKLMEAEKFVVSAKDTAKSALEDVQRKADQIAPKLQTFKADTAERRVKGIVGGVVPKVTAAEEAVEKGKEAAKSLEVLNLDDINVDELQESSSKVLELEKEGQKSALEARQLVADKQRGSNVGAIPGLAQEMRKITDRLQVVLKGLVGLKSSAQAVERILKGKAALDEAGEKMDEADKSVEETENVATPTGEETLPDDKVEAIIKSLEESGALVSAATKLIQAQAVLGKQPSPVQKAFAELLQKLTTRAKEAQGKLDAVKKSSRKWLETYHCQKIKTEAAELVKGAEQSVEKTNEAEEPFLRGIELIPLDESSKAIEACDVAEKEASEAVTKLKGFLTSKLPQLKTFEQETAKETITEVMDSQKTAEKLFQKVAAFKKDMVDRKKSSRLQEAEIIVEAAEEEVKKGVECAKPLEAGNTLSEEESDRECEKLLAAHKAATDKIQEARTLVTQCEKENMGNKTRQENAKKLITRLNDSKTTLSKARASAGEAEAKLTSKQLVAEADETLVKAEASFKGAEAAAAVMLENEGLPIYAHTILKVAVEALSEHMTKTNIDVDALFKKVGGSQADVMKFLGSMSEICGWWADLAFPEEQLLAAFKVMDSDKDGSVSEAEFKSLFQKKYAVTQKINMTEEAGDQTKLPKDQKVVLALEPGAVLEAMSETQKDEAGNTRIQCKAASGETGWVTVSTSRGLPFLRIAQAGGAQDAQKELQDAMKAKRDEVQKCVGFVSSKIKELASKKEGPLTTAKSALEIVQPKIAEVTKNFAELDKKLATAKADMMKRQEGLLRSMRDAKGSFAASTVLGDVIGEVKKVDASGTKVQTDAAAVTKMEADELDKADPVGVLQTLEKDAASIKEAVAEAREKLKAEPDLGEGDTKLLAMTVKTEKLRLEKVLAGALTKSSVAVADVRKLCNSITASKVEAVSSAILSSLAERKVDAKALWAELCENGKDVITEAKLSDYLKSLSGLQMKEDHTKIVFQEILNDGVLSKHRFMRLVQKYFTCVKDIGIAAECDIDSKTLRKFKSGEILEAIGAPHEIKEKGILRVHGRAIEDGLIGWVTMKGNQGTAFLSESQKPYFNVVADTVLRAGEEQGTEEVRTLEKHEVVEIVEGPKPDQLADITRMKCKVGNMVGYVTVKDGAGAIMADKDTKYKCKQAIAFTDGKDMKTSKVLRKVEGDEILVALEAPIIEAGVTRVRARSQTDKLEGWVTVKGNAGSVYLEELPSKMYTVRRNVPLHDKFKAEQSRVLKELNPEDLLEVLEQPKTDKSEPVTKAKVCSVGDGKVGWVTIKGNGQNLKSWTSKYRCMKATDMHDDVKTEGATVVRGIADKEALELLEGPVKEGDDFRAKFRADKDKASGWVTLGGKSGNFLIGIAQAASIGAQK